jgi:hypothetical protein
MYYIDIPTLFDLDAAAVVDELLYSVLCTYIREDCRQWSLVLSPSVRPSQWFVTRCERG